MSNPRADSQEGWNLLQHHFGELITALEELGYKRDQFRHISQSGKNCWLNAGANTGSTNGDEIKISNTGTGFEARLQTVINGEVKPNQTIYLKKLNEITKHKDILDWLGPSIQKIKAKHLPLKELIDALSKSGIDVVGLYRSGNNRNHRLYLSHPCENDKHACFSKPPTRPNYSVILKKKKPGTGDAHDEIEPETKFHNLEELVGWPKLKEFFDTEKKSDIPQSINEKPLKSKKMENKNSILYGPPGTGKTYATIEETLKILDPAYLDANEKNRKALKYRFDELTAAGQVRFVTFHQSFSYEDFVEGLRAGSEEETGNVVYRVEPGVFKQIIMAAQRVEVEGSSTLKIADNTRVWKVSIGGAGQSAVKTHCLGNGEARIGWPDTGNMKNLSMAGKHYLETLGSNDRSTLDAFANQIAEGDVVVSIDGQDCIGAVGVVTRSYFYDETPSVLNSDYPHAIGVDWLYTQLALPAKPLNDGNIFVAKTVYQLWRFKWPVLLDAIIKSGAKPAANTKMDDHATKLPYVLIIDEINRGNVSRIFGELITLIEPTKRAGAEEALSVTLPYSKEKFTVPDNVYLIGTMNTADRSLAGLDIALRRRFAFKEMPPRPELLDDVTIDGTDINIGRMLRVMNQRIAVLLDRDHCLGHAYFMTLKRKEGEPTATLSELAEIFKQNILPLLQEYFFEDWQRIRWVLNDHSKDANHQFIIEDNALSVSDLFGDVAELARSQRRWRLNPSAFQRAKSYVDIGVAYPETQALQGEAAA